MVLDARDLVVEGVISLCIVFVSLGGLSARVCDCAGADGGPRMRARCR